LQAVNGRTNVPRIKGRKRFFLFVAINKSIKRYPLLFCLL
jgi:hypothetical protein